MEATKTYSPKQRAILALERKPPPPGLVPTFELEFQLTQELCGKEFYRDREVWNQATHAERQIGRASCRERV